MATTKEPLQSPLIVEDEALKRNTDCVYFLASPLTCKKGSECEYRHSEYARVNPRDCYYWLNGNCLNPKCSFRHPPLDGLVGPQTGNFTGPPTVATPAPTVPAALQNPTKQGVPCIFFQKGYCLKGDRCPFVHGPNPASTKIQQQVPASAATPEAPAFKKAFGSLEKCTQPKVNFHVNAHKVVEAPAQANVVPKVQPARPTNGHNVGRVYQPPSVVVEEAPKYKDIKPSPVDNGNLRSKTGHTHHGGSIDDLSFQNGRDTEDPLRESSPGFDVLVDNLSDDEYYHDEEQYGRMRGLEGRNLNEFDLDHQNDSNLVAGVDPEMSHNRHCYDSFDRRPEKYAWDNRRSLSERSRVERAHYDRRGSYNKSQSPDFVRNSDLRQRLSSKQTRIGGLKSVVNPDYNDNAHGEVHDYRSSRRHSHRSPIRETSRGHRLQGRIKLPRSSAMNGNEMYSERNERGRNWGRSSPGRQQVSVQQSRLRDRLGGGNLESREGRRSGPIMRKDIFPATGSDFAGPKSLSELKTTKQTDTRQHQVKSQQSVMGRLKDSILPSSNGTDGDVSFEGPKPLSEILKRKRKDPTSDLNSGNREEIKQHENDVKLTSNVSNSAKDAENQVILSSEVEQAMTSEVVNKPAAFEANEEDVEISNKRIKLNIEGESPLLNDDGEIEVNADGEEQEFDGEYEHGDGEYDYEQEDGEGYRLNEIETGEQEVDSMDEDDGDDFAKTLGVSI